MSNRITNKEIRKIHSYMEEIDNPDFVVLLRKLLATFNFLVLRYMELTKKDTKSALAEVKYENEKEKNKHLREKINEQKKKIEELEARLDQEERNGQRIYVDFKECVTKNERLKKRIEVLEGRITENEGQYQYRNTASLSFKEKLTTNNMEQKYKKADDNTK